MPIPTDTFWNIKLLNRVFAVSAIIMVATMGLAVWQDYDKDWRQPQRNARVWDAAFIEEKIAVALTPDEQTHLTLLNRLVSDLDEQVKASKFDAPKIINDVDALKQLDAGKTDPKSKLVGPDELSHLNDVRAWMEKQTKPVPAESEDPTKPNMGTYAQKTQRIAQLESNRAPLIFSKNDLNSNVTVMESHFQDAKTAGDKEEVNRTAKELEASEKELKGMTEELARLAREIDDLKIGRDKDIADLTSLTKTLKVTTGMLESMAKKRAILQPQTLTAKLSDKMRGMPLMQFLNPTEHVQEVVLPDVQQDMSFSMRIATIDRCMTCHVHIDRKDFTEEKVLAFLERSLAADRNMDASLPEAEPKKPDSASKNKPGAAAMAEFWIGWGHKILPQSAFITPRKAAPEIGATVVTLNPIITAIGKTLKLKDGKNDVAPDFDKRVKSAATQPSTFAEGEFERIVITAVNELNGNWSKYDPAQQKQLTAAHNMALAYPEAMRAAVMNAVGAADAKLLRERYRYALCEKVNAKRAERGQPPLDPSSAQLAHPRLDLYAEVDSVHKIDAVGCTSCHDGSGQETDFVLAAHRPRKIWVDASTGEPVLGKQLASAEESHKAHAPDLSSMLDAAIESGPDSLHLFNDQKAEHGATTQPAHAAHASAESETREYVDPARGAAKLKAVQQAEYWAKKYEPGSGNAFESVYEMWDWPMRPMEFIQANCARCHNNMHDVKEEAPVLYKGRALFAKYGCVNCHQMDSIPRDDGTSGAVVEQAPGVPARKVGPDLRHIHEKLSKEFTSSWIWAPKAFRPSTNMPHFFMLENSSSDEELRRTQQEVRAITEYLYRTSTPSAPAPNVPGGRYTAPKVSEAPADVEARVKKGRELFYGADDKPAGLGCLACHANLNDSASGGSETVGEKWIITELVHGGEFSKELAEQSGKAASDSQLADAAKKKYDEMSYNERQLYASEHFGTIVTPLATPHYADGTDKPVFMHHGPELSGVGTKLTVGRTKDEARGWLYDWLKNPRHYSAYTVMPSLRLSDEEAVNLAEYLLAQKRPTLSNEDRAVIAKGHSPEAQKIRDEKWEATTFPRDSAKVKELIAFFLRSRFSEDMADVKADDKETDPTKNELYLGAADALVTKDVTLADAQKRIANENWDRDTLREVMLGKKLVAHYGCMNCHAINGAETFSSPCADLSVWGQKSVDKLDYGYLDPHKVHDLPPTSKLPMVNGISAGTTHIVRSIEAKDWDNHISKNIEVAWPHLEHTRESWIEQKINNSRAYDRGRNMLEPQRQYADDNKVKRDADGNPVLAARGKPYDKLRMPTFYMRDEEVQAITTFVISNRDRLISPRLQGQANSAQARHIAHGRQIAERFNCVSCHKIEVNQPQIQQYWAMLGKTDDLPKNSPPSLRGEGNKVQHQWLFGFLKNVEKIRPLPFIRMPSFPITDEEASEVAAYFNSASNRESQHLKEKIELILKDAPRTRTVTDYQPRGSVTGVAAVPATQQSPEALNGASEPIASLEPVALADAPATQPAAPAGPVLPAKPAKRLEAFVRPATSADLWPVDDWYRQDKYAPIAEYLRNWALNNGLAKAAAFNERTNTPAELAATYKLILYRARFVQNLFDSPYPFTSTPQPLGAEDEARFKLGEQFFYELNCLQCHAMGDPNKRGVGVSDWSAPNMTIVSRRIQRRWANYWVQEPPVIQANTPMPQFFSGETPNPLSPPDLQKTPTYKLDGQDWATAIGMAVGPDADGNNQILNGKPEFIREHYGMTSQEQKDLVLDFVFTASARGYTATEPAPEQLASFASNSKPASIQPATQPAKEAGVVAPPPPGPAKAVENPGKLKGTVKLIGKPPEMKAIAMNAQCMPLHPDPPVEDTVVVDDKGNLRFAVIALADVPPGQYPVPAPAVIDQKGCMYEPHVAAVMVGQEIKFKSTDPFAHNVHTPYQNLPTMGPDNAGKSVGASKVPERMNVKCDVHPWMGMYIKSFEHPFFAVSAADGTFTITGIPPGKYTLTIWHEKYGESSQSVTIEGGKEADVNLEFKAK